MDLTDIYELINSNPIYQSIAVALILVVIYSILKKLFKMLIISLLITGIYVAYLYSIGDEYIVKKANKAIDDFQNTEIYNNLKSLDNEQNNTDSINMDNKHQENAE